jgi:hypothetical protein
MISDAAIGSAFNDAASVSEVPGNRRFTTVHEKQRMRLPQLKRSRWRSSR